MTLGCFSRMPPQDVLEVSRCSSGASEVFQMSPGCSPMMYSSLFTISGLHRSSIEKFRFGSAGVWGPIFTSNSKLWRAQQLRIIIPLRFGLVIFNFHFPKPKGSSCSWFSDLADMSMTPQTNSVNLWFCRINANSARTSNILFETYLFWTHHDIKFHFSGKRRVPANPWDPSYKSLKILNLGSISFKKIWNGSLGFFNSGT